MSDTRTPLSRTMIVPATTRAVDVTTPPAEADRQLAFTVLPPASRWSLRLKRHAADGLSDVAGFEIAQSINTVTGTANLSLRLGPDEWLLIGAAPSSPTTADLDAALAGTAHALTDVSDRQVAFVLAGEAAADVLNAGCPLDLDVSCFPPGTATRTVFAKVEVILARQAEPDRFRLECWRSFARYTDAFIRDTAMLNGIAISPG